MLVKGQVAIVTGAASRRGLGLAAARLLAEHGARVAILDIDLDAAREAVRSLKGRGHFALRCDVTRRAQCEKAAQRVLARHGRIDILVNNAGITSPQRLMEVDDATYDRVFDINMRGTLHMTQAVVPAMRSQKSGSIVNMSSVSAQRGGGVFGGSHYSAAKGAVLGYTKACARELGPDNIRVNAICPSMIDTDITGGALTPERRAEILKSIPMGRIGTAEEVAGCVLFLASPLSAYVTGAEIDINGGSHIH
ncbi:MAG: SDR family oxidoreductase [Hyphomicrobiales bacterium]|uniref:SDR family NAD(P)-dependent oxidoreductase n=1 Tax=Rhabdaerophilum calidifontis TaxID=2604328 RepID=UPI0012394453|nr:SDR family NAD(P)-dependent oxidoreductase [Rhabdaerophilum calidifontis]MCA1951507.1 SDR family oxidoreductase [Hyphomicrobiales bacterium]MCA1998421.1 SDR family oxidoreductase [Hyphomicrobiales bacterium]